MARIAMISVHECPLAASEGKERGGINVYVYELSLALGRLGWLVDIFTRIQDDTNARVVQVNKQVRVIHLPNGPHTPLSKKDILNYIDEFTEGMISYMKTEQIQYDIIHAHYYLSGFVAQQVRRHFSVKTPMGVTFHTLGLLKQLINRGELDIDPKERIAIEKDLTKEASCLITTSESGRTYLTALYGGNSRCIQVIPPGVDTALFRKTNTQEAKKFVGADANHRIILAVGRMDPVKGFDVLLYAIKILFSKKPELAESVCVWFVGGEIGENEKTASPQLLHLNTLQQSLQMETTVRFIPALSQKKLAVYYNAADVVVMPSHYESFGMVALEALACGTPVIATDVTGISPVLKEFPGGHVVSANNPILLAGQLNHVLAEQGDKAKTHHEIALFDWHIIGATMSRLYETIIRKSL